MLIEGLLDVVFNLVSLLTSGIDIPPMPDQVRTFISEACGYIRMGIGILQNWLDLEYLLILFGLVLAVDVGLLVYKLIMWFLRKIPMLGIG